VNCPTHYSTENKIIVFNMDSTLIDAETIDKLARATGVISEKNTKRSMCGELVFGKIFIKEISLLEGFRFETAYDAVNSMPEASELILYAKNESNKASMISGIFINTFEAVVGIDLIISNCQRCN
jgi:phosphoserine phosphatase